MLSVEWRHRRCIGSTNNVPSPRAVTQHSTLNCHHGTTDFSQTRISTSPSFHLLIRPPEMFLGPLLFVELAKPDRGRDAARVARGSGVLLVFVVSADRDDDMIEMFAENLEDFVDRLLLGLVHGGKVTSESDGCRVGKRDAAQSPGFAVHCGCAPLGNGGASIPARGSVPASSCRQWATSPAGP